MRIHLFFLLHKIVYCVLCNKVAHTLYCLPPTSAPPTLAPSHFGAATLLNYWKQLRVFYYNEENSTLKVFLGLIRALGLLPINDVMIGYQVILELQLINNINSLTTYLTVNYSNNNKIPQWNVHDLNDHRTNNDMEGYHHRLRERFIPSLWKE